MSLHSILKSEVAEWRESNYESEYVVISEILDFNYDSETQALRFLRKAQFEALETYWYLRLVEKTPHIFDLYKRLYDEPVELFKALGIFISQEDLIKIMSKGGTGSIFEKIRTDNFLPGFLKFWMKTRQMLKTSIILGEWMTQVRQNSFLNTKAKITGIITTHLIF